MPECTNARLRKRRSSACAFLCLSVGVLLTSGCSRARAKTEPDAPALNVPVPPPREVEVADATLPAPPPPPPPEEPARRAPAAPPAPVRPRPAPPRPEPAPAPAAAAAAPAPAEPPKPVEEPAKPPTTTLQTAPTGNEGEAERTIRTVLTKATADLNRIDYRALNADARTQYDTAKRFVTQAQQALRAKNLVFARNLADKAAALADQLGGK